jgi:hypothetical protein
MREELEQLIDQIESARIIACALFEQYCNKKMWARALFFQVIRDVLNDFKSSISVVIAEEDMYESSVNVINGDSTQCQQTRKHSS